MKELAIDYTNCVTKSPLTTADFDPLNDTTKEMDSDRVSASFKNAMKNKPKWGHAREEFLWPSGKKQDTDVCIITFEIPEEIKPPILFYYRLTNFYQNHRRYVKSLDINQLKGDAVSASGIKSGECDPLDLAPDGRPYYPCGLIANSMFNDTFKNLTVANAQQQNGQSNDTYNFSLKGISWGSEGDLYGKSKYKPSDVVPPPNWQEQYPEDGYNNQSSLPDLHTDEAFQVWMRTAGLPTFSKLAMRNDHDVMTEATYRLKIFDRMNHLLSFHPIPANSDQVSQ